MTRFMAAICLTLASHVAYATTYNISAGTSVASINSTLSTAATAGGVSTIQFGAGSTTVTSPINIPCPNSSTTMVLTGPVVSTATATTAIFNGPVAGGRGFNMAGSCSQAVTVQYLQWNGNRPQPGGGGWLFVNPGVSNLTVQYNYCHGMQANLNGSEQSDGCVWFDGVDSNNSGHQTDSNDSVLWNQFGDTAGGDCSNIMNLFNNGSGTTYGSAGGYCNGVGVHSYVTNMTIQHNNFNSIEQGMKFFAAGFSSGCLPGGSGSCVYYHYFNDNTDIEFNDLHKIHRIGLEMQVIASTTIKVDNNDYYDAVTPGYISWALSVPSCCATGNNFVNADNNILIANTPPPQGATIGYAGAIEWWSKGTCNNNLIQGYWHGGCEWGQGTAPWTSNNNVCQFLGDGDCLHHEVEPGTTIAPTSSNNTLGTTVFALTSAAPVITPTPTGTYSGSVSVTITDNGLNGNSGPPGNTSIYYTTNGTTPTTASAFCDSPCPITVSAGATVKAIGMWGAKNQPKSYPTGYGFVPSSVSSAFYPAGSAPTLTGVTLTLQDGTSTVQVGNSKQACANTTYSGGQTGQSCNGAADAYGTTFSNWASSDTTKASITSTGNVSGVGAGSANLTVRGGAITSSAFALTVTAAAPVLQSVAPSCPSTSIAVGQTTTCTLQCTYTGPTVSQCPSAAWASDNTSAATVGASSGVVTGVTAGSANITGTYGGLSNPINVSVTSAAPPAATLTGVSINCNPASVQAGLTIACAATCSYSDGSFTDCTTTDGHGTLAGTWTSTVPAKATVSSTGVVTGIATGSSVIGVSAGGFTASPGFTESVTAASAAQVLGNNNFNTIGHTGANYITAQYAVTAAGTSSTVSSCTFYLPTGTTYTAGSKWDCGAVLAPSATTQATAWLCHATYTTQGTAADVGWHTLSITGCGTLASSAALWVAVDTNETSPSQPGAGFYNCGGSCSGSAPTSGIGTYPCRYISATYGTYTGMGTAMNTGCGPGTTYQVSQYLTLTTPTPTLVGGYLTTPGNTASLMPGASVQLYPVGCYSDGTCYLAFPTATPYGDTLTSITSSAPSVLSVGAVGSANPALVTGQSVGTATISAVLTGSKPTYSYGFTVSTMPNPLPPKSSRVFSR